MNRLRLDFRSITKTLQVDYKHITTCKLGVI